MNTLESDHHNFAWLRHEPSVSCLALAIDEPELAEQATAAPAPVLPLLLSLLLHGLIGLLLLKFGLPGSREVAQETVARPAAMQLRFVSPSEPAVPSAPQQAGQDPQNDLADSPPPVEADVPQQPPAVPEIPVRVQTTDIPQRRVTVPAVEPAAGSETPVPETRAPEPAGVLSLRQLVENLQQEEPGGLSLQECTELQQRNPLVACGSSGTSDPGALERNPVQANGARSRSIVTLMAQRRHLLDERLQEAGTTAGLADFLIYNNTTIEEDISGSRTSPGQRLNDFININSRTYQMMKRVNGGRAVDL